MVSDRRRYIFWGLLLIGLLWGARGVGTTEWSGAYDSDLYHFTSVRWAKEYPAVPGLANLHMPLGLSSLYLLYAAIMDHGLWYRQSAWIVPGIFSVMFFAQLVWTWLYAPTTARHLKLFCLLLLAYAALLVSDNVPNLYYDRPAVIAMGLAILEFLQLSQPEQATRDRRAGIFTMLLLVAISIAIKPVGWVLALLLGAWGLVMARRLPSRCAWLVGIALPLMLAGGLLIRNAILSGWLLYPAPYGQLPVAWAVPANPVPLPGGGLSYSMRNQSALMRAWARQPGPDYEKRAAQDKSFPWLQPWWQRNRHAIELKLLGAGLLFLLFGCCRRPDGHLFFAVLAVSATLLAWFVLAPDLRFGEGYFWLWFALTGAMCLSSMVSWRYSMLSAGLWAVLLLMATFPGWSWPPKITIWHLGHALVSNLRNVQLDNGQQPPLVVWVPEGDDRCGDAPLPCTPFPQDALCCRTPGNIRNGFYLAKPAATRP
ncbi:MAG: hypothetical protein EPN23_04580 [Verrucomicrobia bacterium]|nr:MAG: hypothetical protein EPN23_04580 [Verrucomicrobiota bacterium]